jgi:hypothetical protein
MLAQPDYGSEGMCRKLVIPLDFFGWIGGVMPGDSHFAVDISGGNPDHAGKQEHDQSRKNRRCPKSPLWTTTGIS